MKKEFENSTHTPSTVSTTPTAPTIPAERAPVNSVSIDAVNFIMDNVFDWEAQKEHAGLRITYEDCKTLVKSLRANLDATCPDVRDNDVTDLYGELLHNNWAGQYQDIKDLTEKVVSSYLEAEMGYMEPITALKRQMKGKINFMETHYSDVGHSEDVPTHVLAETLDKKGSLGESLESRKASVLAIVQEKRGQNGDILDGENDPALLEIIKALNEASTDEELVEALESFEDYLMHDELKSMGQNQQPALAAADGVKAADIVKQEEQPTSLASRIRQKLPALSRFFG